MSLFASGLRALIEWTFYIGLMGGLVDLTRAMIGNAGDAQRHGLVSFRALNQQLMGPPLGQK